MRALKQGECRFAVVLVSSGRIRALNRQYRGRDYPTDVLSFLYPGEVVDGVPFLGEVVIAPEMAWRQGSTRRGGLEREMRMLLVHGILHLLGYDHETDRGEMASLQRKCMRRRLFLRGESLVRKRAAT